MLVKDGSEKPQPYRLIILYVICCTCVVGYYAFLFPVSLRLDRRLVVTLSYQRAELSLITSVGYANLNFLAHYPRDKCSSVTMNREIYNSLLSKKIGNLEIN